MIAPSARCSRSALAFWSWSSACGSGTRIAGRPIAASSATVEAPERDTTRWLAAIRRGRSEKNGSTSAVTPMSRIGGADALEVLLARLLGDMEARPHRHRHELDRGRHDVGHDARALAAAEGEDAERLRRVSG